jgi:hypothetical protein
MVGVWLLGAVVVMVRDIKETVQDILVVHLWDLQFAIRVPINIMLIQLHVNHPLEPVEVGL